MTLSQWALQAVNGTPGCINLVDAWLHEVSGKELRACYTAGYDEFRGLFHDSSRIRDQPSSLGPFVTLSGTWCYMPEGAQASAPATYSPCLILVPDNLTSQTTELH